MPARRPYVYKRKGRDGWTVYDPNPPRGQGKRSYTRAKERDAKDLADELYKRARAEDSLAADELLRDYAVRWIAQAKHGIRSGTARGYAAAIDSHIVPALGDLTLRAITRTHVKNFVVAKLDAGLAKATVKNIRGTLHVMLEDAKDDGLIATNPAAHGARSRRKSLRLTPTKAERREQVLAFTVDELALFLDTARKHVPEWWLLFRVLAFTGMRIGEALALKWPDVDWRAKTIHVERGLTRDGIEPTKTGEERVVDVPDDVTEDLERHDVATKAAALRAGEKRAEWIFSSRVGTPLDYGYALHAFKRTLAHARMPLRYGPHTLRHSYASINLAAGESVYYIQKQLGHADIRMTVNTYGSWLPAGNREASNRFSALVHGASLARTQGKGRAAGTNESDGSR